MKFSAHNEMNQEEVLEVAAVALRASEYRQSRPNLQRRSQTSHPDEVQMVKECHPHPKILSRG